MVAADIASRGVSDARVLEIGAGSGYGAAVLGRIAGEVWTIERHETLADEARRRIIELGYRNVRVDGRDDGNPPALFPRGRGIAGDLPVRTVTVAVDGATPRPTCDPPG